MTLTGRRFILVAGMTSVVLRVNNVTARGFIPTLVREVCLAESKPLPTLNQEVCPARSKPLDVRFEPYAAEQARGLPSVCKVQQGLSRQPEECPVADVRPAATDTPTSYRPGPDNNDGFHSRKTHPSAATEPYAADQARGLPPVCKVQQGLPLQPEECPVADVRRVAADTPTSYQPGPDNNGFPHRKTYSSVATGPVPKAKQAADHAHEVAKEALDRAHEDAKVALGRAHEATKAALGRGHEAVKAAKYRPKDNAEHREWPGHGSAGVCPTTAGLLNDMFNWLKAGVEGSGAPSIHFDWASPAKHVARLARRSVNPGHERRGNGEQQAGWPDQGSKDVCPALEEAAAAAAGWPGSGIGHVSGGAPPPDWILGPPVQAKHAVRLARRTLHEPTEDGGGRPRFLARRSTDLLQVEQPAASQETQSGSRVRRAAAPSFKERPETGGRDPLAEKPPDVNAGGIPPDAETVGGQANNGDSAEARSGTTAIQDSASSTTPQQPKVEPPKVNSVNTEGMPPDAETVYGQANNGESADASSGTAALQDSASSGTPQQPEVKPSNNIVDTGGTPPDAETVYGQANTGEPSSNTADTGGMPPDVYGQVNTDDSAEARSEAAAVQEIASFGTPQPPEVKPSSNAVDTGGTPPDANIVGGQVNTGDSAEPRSETAAQDSAASGTPQQSEAELPKANSVDTGDTPPDAETVYGQINNVDSAEARSGTPAVQDGVSSGTPQQPEAEPLKANSVDTGGTPPDAETVYKQADNVDSAGARSSTSAVQDSVSSGMPQQPESEPPKANSAEDQTDPSSCGRRPISDLDAVQNCLASGVSTSGEFPGSESPGEVQQSERGRPVSNPGKGVAERIGWYRPQGAKPPDSNPADVKKPRTSTLDMKGKNLSSQKKPP